MRTIQLAEAVILIVEDDENNRIVISRLLALIGASKDNIFQVEEDPLARLPPEPDRYDMVLLDLHIPKKDGYTILGELRQDPRFANTRIIALTANVMQDDLEQTRKAGFDGFIGKPINAASLKTTIEKILSGESIWTI
ncbi:MAG: hypothetical protein A2087_04430 [Spirochaetes bacterium GWD1_61_31]|nr:MAG: hypothetical protein A2Y37_01375 [Spirochaetes bacterium GWB1_60_80]OHD28556.1 MAG: hypothetical protein A2004_07105 [Spirochaetes bacterium GWC1_61_12]OHD37359.1 MAG: hypothetical protein A2087_04430 [Spirochaetes bacterium GWD1_61_31]OHD41853.1 MAG: hypothetical protein A2Y35_04470 [Spirochaetes bacterium GWE1_60_18]OHD57834.1 MAG: hypothetical protein A2Y32_14165 [Spirochaetes bacterium GWF1_60_12]HAP42568.1 hypothetical protein [Spirochaetaceae bacterium]